jgi:hypothetical protein
MTLSGELFDLTSLISYPKRFGSYFVARDDGILSGWLDKVTGQ